MKKLRWLRVCCSFPLKIKAIILKFWQSTAVICRCFSSLLWSVLLDVILVKSHLAIIMKKKKHLFFRYLRFLAVKGCFSKIINKIISFLLHLIVMRGKSLKISSCHMSKNDICFLCFLCASFWLDALNSPTWVLRNCTSIAAAESKPPLCKPLVRDREGKYGSHLHGPPPHWRPLPALLLAAFT